MLTKQKFLSYKDNPFNGFLTYFSSMYCLVAEPDEVLGWRTNEWVANPLAQNKQVHCK